MEDFTISSHSCTDCAKGVLTLKRSGLSVTGKCDRCGRQVDFQLPAASMDELTDYLIEFRVARTKAVQDFEVRKTFAEVEGENMARRP